VNLVEWVRVLGKVVGVGVQGELAGGVHGGVREGRHGEWWGGVHEGRHGEWWGGVPGALLAGFASTTSTSSTTLCVATTVATTRRVAFVLFGVFSFAHFALVLLMHSMFLVELRLRHSDQGSAVDTGTFVTNDVVGGWFLALNPIPAVHAEGEAGGNRVGKGNWVEFGFDPFVKREFHPCRNEVVNVGPPGRDRVLVVGLPHGLLLRYWGGVLHTGSGLRCRSSLLLNGSGLRRGRLLH
jgi:hypothetical protein